MVSLQYPDASQFSINAVAVKGIEDKRHTYMANPATANDLGDRIRAIRTARGWSQGRLAQEMGKTQSEVNRWEQGRVRPGFDTLVLISQTLGVTFENLVSESGDLPEPAPEPGAAPEEPRLERLEWIPDLLRAILADRTTSAAEKAALMAEVNAAGMRFWAVAAEWAAGQRGIAMQVAEEASGKRAEAHSAEAHNSGERALTLQTRGATSRAAREADPMSPEEVAEQLALDAALPPQAAPAPAAAGGSGPGKRVGPRGGGAKP